MSRISHELGRLEIVGGRGDEEQAADAVGDEEVVVAHPLEVAADFGEQVPRGVGRLVDRWRMPAHQARIDARLLLQPGDRELRLEPESRLEPLLALARRRAAAVEVERGAEDADGRGERQRVGEGEASPDRLHGR